MKVLQRIVWSVLVLGLVPVLGCQKEDGLEMAEDQPGIYAVTIGPTVRLRDPEAFMIRFAKPSPCQKVKETKVSTAGLTVNYNVILEGAAVSCPTTATQPDSAESVFASSATGTYTLNFLLNNRLSLVRKVTVIP